MSGADWWQMQEVLESLLYDMMINNANAEAMIDANERAGRQDFGGASEGAVGDE